MTIYQADVRLSNSFEDKKNSQGGNRKRINMTQMYEKSGQNLT